MKNKKVLIVSSILLTSVLAMTGCNAKPSDEIKYKEEKLLNVKVPEFSDVYYCGLETASSNALMFDPDAKVVICTNKDVLIYMPVEDKSVYKDEDYKLIDKATLSDEEYSNIVNSVDRERLYKMDINDEPVDDGLSSYIYLYGADDELVKKAGCYGAITSFPESFWDMRYIIVDNLPDEAWDIMSRQYTRLHMLQLEDSIIELNEERINELKEEHYGDVYSFSFIESGYTDLIDYQRNKISMEFDLDNDGLNEAIVCETGESSYDETNENGEHMKTGEYIYEITKMYFIGEDKSVTNIELLEGRYIYTNQFLITKDGQSYITMNCSKDKYGDEAVGEVLTIEDDQIKFLIGDDSYEGFYYFTGEDDFESEENTDDENTEVE